MLSPGHDPVRALRERATQNALAGLGYPVPRVLIASADREPLGAGFLVMERAAGRPLLATRRPGIGRTLAEAHARLHALNAEALLRALDDEGRAAGWRSTATRSASRAISPRSTGASRRPGSPAWRTGCAGSAPGSPPSGPRA